MTIIRPGTTGDVEAIAYVHVEGWRTTYRGIVPDAYLDALSVEQRLAGWERRLNQPGPGYVIFVAEDENGVVVGFADGGPSHDTAAVERYAGELYAIYLLPQARGHGLGSQLMRAVANALAANGMPSLLVWVLAENPARAFYEAMGGQFVREAPIAIGGAPLIEVAYGWDEEIMRRLTARRSLRPGAGS